ncbi:MAG: transposase [Candidatus Euphemobacter frigidus]|nr:transposase [Candidatus Euphemobacter frigidus]MDP8276062.1 transposase [Candidatus Euphemobacter frigidus]
MLARLFGYMECASLLAQKIIIIMSGWHHSPAHKFIPNTMYMITGATLHKKLLFQGDAKLSLLESELFNAASKYEWEMQSWSFFANHYHFIARAPSDATTLKKMIQRTHSITARKLNHMDTQPGRRVWFQYWDTCLTYEKSYLARLNYVNNNAVHHGLVPVAEQYRFCSAGWFARKAAPEFRRKVDSCLFDRINVIDDF